MRGNKQLFILSGIIFIITLIIVIIVVINFFSSSKNTTSKTIPTPTTVPYTRSTNGIFNFTPLQKTIINKTTDKEVQQDNKIISKSHLGDITVYKTISNTVGQTDEIRTKNGVVIFESTNIFNKKAGGYPPKISVYETEFGQPEKILKGVSPLGPFISAYIYASHGFTLFVNHNTGTVYIIQRFSPMSMKAYEKDYSEYLRPAPAYPKEGFNQ